MPGPTRPSGGSSRAAPFLRRAPHPGHRVPRLSQGLGVRVLLKREDLAHTGSHKINNVVGQALLARRMGKRRLIAETGAGQHGVATATAAAPVRDRVRDLHGGGRHRAPGAQRLPDGAAGLRGPIGGKRQPHPEGRRQRGVRDWVASVEHTHYCLGSVMGPHPYPWMVRELQRVVGDEARAQCRVPRRPAPTWWWRVPGAGPTPPAPSPGSSIPSRLVGVEAIGGAAIGHGDPGGPPRHAVPSDAGRGRTDPGGRVDLRRAGLPGIGPEHAHLADIGRARYETADDTEVVAAFQRLARTEGIIPALESAHALAWVIRAAGRRRSCRVDRPRHPVGAGGQGRGQVGTSSGWRKADPR